MLKASKKILALVLSLIMAFCALPMAASAAEEANDADPVIYILGYGGELFADKVTYKGGQIYPLNTDIEAVVKEAATPCLTALAYAKATGDYSAYCAELYNTMAPIYEGIVLNPDGTAKTDENGITSGKDYRMQSFKSKHWTGDEYYVFYDWRLSPLDLVESTIAPLVEQASAKSPTKKVDIVARCYGANLVSTYLAQNDDVTDMVDDVIMYIPSTEGIGLIGRIFSGKIELNSKAINEYVNELLKYENIIDDSFVKNFIDVFLLISEQIEMLDMGADMVQDLIDNIREDFIAPIIRNSYGSFPSFWAMVPDEYFQDAVDFIYSTDELREEYAGTIELITAYHDNIQVNSRETLAAHAEKGLNINVISKYNLPSAPLFGKANPMADAIAETTLTSFGATTADFGKTLGTSYISAMTNESRKYLSADEKIDASTCLFPEKTWFIKNCYHDYFEAEALYTFLDTILTCEEDATIDTFAEYPQFIDAGITAETLVPVTEKDKDIPVEGSKDAKFQMLFKFIMFVIQLLIKIINGDLDFGSLLG